MTTTVTAKGQVTIPKAVRELLGIVPGSQVDFLRTVDGNVILARADQKRPLSRFQKLRGHGVRTRAVRNRTLRPNGTGTMS
jgi:antitoxin PrlF